MHELGITQNIVDLVSERVDGASVRRVTLEVGRLSAIAPDAIRFCFDIVSQGTALEGATLEILRPPGRGSCRCCGAEVELLDLLACCPCGGIDIDYRSGDELRIKEVEMA